MKELQVAFTYTILDSENELPGDDYSLLLKAREAASFAYAPYSQFKVGAAAILNNGLIVAGSNQENASYPSGMCAERSLLANAAQTFPDVPIKTMAISYINIKGDSKYPATPCGFCRQVLVEFERRVKQPIRLLICGSSGPVFIIPESSLLLPLSFTSNDLK